MGPGFDPPGSELGKRDQHAFRPPPRGEDEKHVGPFFFPAVGYCGRRNEDPPPGGGTGLSTVPSL